MGGKNKQTNKPLGALRPVRLAYMVKFQANERHCFKKSSGKYMKIDS